MTRDAVPEFFVYGEPARPVELSFLHVEAVSDRSSIHSGSVAMHRHPDLGQITFWTAGSGTYRIEDRDLDFCVPAASFVPSGVVHGFEMVEGSDALVVSIANDMLGALAERTDLSLSAPTFVAGAPSDPAWDQLARAVRDIQREYREQRTGVDRMLDALAVIALSALHRLTDGAPAVAPSPTSIIAENFRHLVDRSFFENLRVEDYADRLGTTPYLLAKAVHETVGRSVKDVVLSRRLLEGKRLLRFTVRSVEDIAFEVGFRDVAYFSRFFSARCGQPPSAWRRSGTR